MKLTEKQVLLIDSVENDLRVIKGADKKLSDITQERLIKIRENLLALDDEIHSNIIRICDWCGQPVKRNSKGYYMCNSKSHR